MNKKATKRAGTTTTTPTPQNGRLGDLPDDAIWVGRCLRSFGKTETWLAKESQLSQKMVNYFLRGERKLSADASTRVMKAVAKGFELKKLEDQALEQAWHQMDPKDNLRNLKMLSAMASTPRTSDELDKWKSDEIQRLSEEIRAERERSASLEEVVSNLKEVASLYKGWVGRLQQQLRDAGITPTD